LRRINEDEEDSYLSYSWSQTYEHYRDDLVDRGDETTLRVLSAYLAKKKKGEKFEKIRALISPFPPRAFVAHTTFLGQCPHTNRKLFLLRQVGCVLDGNLVLQYKHCMRESQTFPECDSDGFGEQGSRHSTFCVGYWSEIEEHNTQRLEFSKAF
jgi:hypothetical protein